MDFFASTRRRLPGQINFGFSQFQFRRSLRLLFDAPQQGADASDQFIRAERLHEIIIGAGVEAVNAIFNLSFRREHQHRHGIGEATQLGADLEAIQLRHHHVEQDEVGLFA